MNNIHWETFYGLVYAFFCACLVAPPQEFVSAGLTIQNLLSSYLGDEQQQFIQYHIKRTTTTLLIHSMLPLGYTLMLLYVDARVYAYNFISLSTTWKFGMVFSILLPLCTLAYIAIWHRNNWNGHPIARTLTLLAPPRDNWKTVAATINMELRCPTQFSGGHYSRQVRVTENWIIKVGTYGLNIAHQRNVIINMLSSRELRLSYDTAHGLQMIELEVKPIDRSRKSFNISLNAENYSELKTHLQAPIVNVRNIVVRQSISDRFIEAFTECVNNNNKYRFDPSSSGEGLEQCIGCLQAPAGIKLMKLCAEAEEGNCRQCYCRPMWCLNCMAKWFCNRQNQNAPATWLAGRAPCPMCRAVFCMADVCLLELI